MVDLIEARRQRRRIPPRKPLPWYPAVVPPPGFRLDHDGVTFEAVTAEPHTRSRYPGVWLVTWRTHCTDCGAELTTMSTAKGWDSLHRKRCPQCRTAFVASQCQPTVGPRRPNGRLDRERRAAGRNAAD